MAAQDPSYRRLRARWSALQPWDLPTARGLGALLRTLRSAGIEPVDGLFLDQCATLAAPAETPHALEGLVLPAAWLRLGYSLVVHTGQFPVCPAPDPTARARDALVGMVRWQLGRVTSLLDDVATDRSPEDLHQLRIALRRGRTVLRLLDPESPAPGEGLALTTALVEASGAVRDVDIGLALVRQLPLPESQRAPAEALLAARRHEKFAALRSLVGAPAVHGALLQLVRPWSPLESPRCDTATAAERAWKAARKRLRKALQTDLREPEAFHFVRRRARRLRDVIEVFGHTLASGRRRWRAALGPLQSLLGELQDLDTLLATLSAEVPEMDPVRALLQQRRTQCLAQLPAPLVELVGRLH